jgi:hypothetical protein
VNGYRSERLQGPTLGEFRSVTEHIGFLAEIAGPASAGTDGKPLREALRALNERLSALSD